MLYETRKGDYFKKVGTVTWVACCQEAMEVEDREVTPGFVNREVMGDFDKNSFSQTVGFEA